MAVRRELGIAERERDAVLGGFLEQRARGGVRHLALEPAVDFGWIGHVPARKERSERELGIDDEIAAFGLRLLDEIEHAPHHELSAVGLLDRAQLGAADAQYPSHRFLLQ